MEAPDKSKEEGIVVMPTVVPDPPDAGGVEAVPETGKESPPGKTGRASDRKKGADSGKTASKSGGIDERNRQ